MKGNQSKLYSSCTIMAKCSPIVVVWQCLNCRPREKAKGQSLGCLQERTPYYLISIIVVPETKEVRSQQLHSFLREPAFD